MTAIVGFGRNARLFFPRHQIITPISRRSHCTVQRTMSSNNAAPAHNSHQFPQQRITSKSTELFPGEFVRRAIPQQKCRSVGPFVFLDHFGPTNRAMDVGPHPHIGLCTLTYLYDGCVLHRDSTGAEQPILPGQVNWMCAGRGVTHSERPPLEEENSLLHGLQFWIALPKDQEDVTPVFHHSPTVVNIQNENGIAGKDVQVKLVVGEALGQRQENIPLVHGLEGMFLLSVEFGSDNSDDKTSKEEGINGVWACPPLGTDIQVGLYVASGAVTVNEQETPLCAGEMLVAMGDQPLQLTTNVAETKVAIVGGRPYPEQRRLLWNFCSSDPAKLKKAAEDWSRLDRSIFPLVVNESNEDSIDMPSRSTGGAK
eukprot:CAMPEP_0183717906 /NCGR_PEP_ID=MMETSP0737-20130205/11335_1 /TAXON_ID=385413 /ORGANISM="Thalassiosira miniscula, Strain CCMP1093" /LENGTH=368 /DNA_ID=CAMNT_0025947383 /DNA_START=36 /DNA_END=1142 /DNA_ORIENTATION=-